MATLKNGYQNIDSQINMKTSKFQQLPLSIETPNSEFSLDQAKDNQRRIFRVLGFGLFISGLMFIMTFHQSAETLLGDAATTNTTSLGGYCCQFALDTTDTCGTCLAKQDTGLCSQNTENCAACGGKFCENEPVAETPAPGVCCHYALDASDICGTCLAPDHGHCGRNPHMCAACGGGMNAGWCASVPTKDKKDADKDTTDTKDKKDTVVDDADKDATDVEDKKDTVIDDADKDATDVEDKKDAVVDDADKDATDAEDKKDAVVDDADKDTTPV
jgi:hypothetical protein